MAWALGTKARRFAPTGGRAAAIGNNPFAYAAPGGRYRAVLFDVCMSKVAASKLVIALA